MNTRILITAFFVTALCSVSFASAQEGTPATVPSDNARTERQELREARKSELTENLQNRIINLSHNIINRFTAASERMQNITTRLESRIEKLRSQGIDVIPAELKLFEAKNNLGKISTNIDNLGIVDNVIKGDTPRESFKQIRTQIITTRDLIKLTHQNLTEAVTLLKEAIRTTSEGKGVSDAVRNNNALETSTTTE